MISQKNIAWAIAFAAAAGTLIMLRRRESSLPSLINDMRTDPNLPRGYRNNNPLNIQKSASPWIGKVFIGNTDPRFEQFTDLVYGYRAALVTMRTYIRKYGLDTVAKIIGRWAPENENYTAGYIQDVCYITGLAPDKHVGLNDRDSLTKMAYAMSIIENGTKDSQGQDIATTYGLPDMEIINQAWDKI